MDTPVEVALQTGAGHTRTEPVLVLKLKKKTLARYPLTGFCMTVGRSSESDIMLDSSSGVSRNHAQILVIDGEVVMEDLGSRNGTFVNGKPRKRRTLLPGDRIAIGHYRLHFLREPQPVSENQVTELFKLWRDAAVTDNHHGCRLCHSAVDSEPFTEPESETGEYPQLDDAGLCADGEAGRSADASSFPQVSVVSTFGRSSDEEDEIMEKVRRLVDQEAVPDEEGAPSPAQSDRNSRFDLRSPRKLRRKMTACRKLEPVRRLTRVAGPVGGEKPGKFRRPHRR